MSFNMPARQVYIAELVGARLLRNAVALNNTGLNFCRVAGPALAGALLAAPEIGVGGVFVAMALMYGVVLVSLLRLPPSKPPEGAQQRPGARGWAELVEGLAYIGRSPVLLALLGLAFVPLIFGVPYQTLMPLFAEEVFLGDGEIDFSTILRLLQDAGYDGVIGPEHLGDPRWPGDDPEAAAIAFLRQHLPDEKKN